MGKRGIAALGLAVVLLAGCTATDEAVEKTWPGPTADQEAQWVFPIDQYRLTMPESGALDYADSLVLYDCMADNGFPNYQIGPTYSEAAYNTSEFSTYSEVWPIFNETTAAKYGYHEPPRRFDVDRDTLVALNGQQMSQAMAEQLNKCLGVPDSPTENRELSEFEKVGSLDSQTGSDMWDIYYAAFKAEPVVEAGKQWHECMTPLGIADLPEIPDGLTASPTPSQWEAWWPTQEAVNNGNGGTTVTQGPEKPITVEEINTAVADAKCRESSGYTHELYTAIWNGEYQKLATDSEFADRMKSNRAAMDAAVTKAKQIIAAHGGN